MDSNYLNAKPNIFYGSKRFCGVGSFKADLIKCVDEEVEVTQHNWFSSCFRFSDS